MKSGEANSTGKKVRKAYTITKSRESWSDEEHDKFIEALQLFDRDWKKIEDFVASKTVIQIRSHAQKYFLKVEKTGRVAHVPPPRPKRKATHRYPLKHPLNDVLVPSQDNAVSFSPSFSPGYPTWDDASAQMNQPTSGLFLPSQYECSLDMDQGGSVPASEPSTQQKSSIHHGLPDFVEVYSFIGSVFDPDTKDHAQKLKEMDPINFETVLLLMQNLTTNLSSPDFEAVLVKVYRIREQPFLKS